MLIVVLGISLWLIKRFERKFIIIVCGASRALFWRFWGFWILSGIDRWLENKVSWLGRIVCGWYIEGTLLAGRFVVSIE